MSRTKKLSTSRLLGLHDRLQAERLLSDWELLPLVAQRHGQAKTGALATSGNALMPTAPRDGLESATPGTRGPGRVARARRTGCGRGARDRRRTRRAGRRARK